LKVSVFDIHIFTYNVTAGKEEPGLPGLFTAVPPRRAARGREKDLLVLLLNLRGNNGLSSENQTEILEKLAAAYYKTKGTVTYALKAIVEQANERLLARNIRLQRDGTPVAGIFNAAVLHGNTLYIAHAGPTHSFVLTHNTVEIFTDDASTTRSLGTNKAVGIRYYRIEVEPGDLALMCSTPPSGWNVKTLAGGPQLSLDQMRRRLLIDTQRDLRFIMLRLRRGKGEIKTVELRPVESQPDSQQIEATAPAKVPASSLDAQKHEPEILAEKASESQPEPRRIPDSARVQEKEKLESEQEGKSAKEKTPGEVSKGLFRPKPGEQAKQPAPTPVEEPSDFPPHLGSKEIESGIGKKPWSAGLGDPDFTRQVEEQEHKPLIRRGRVERQARRTVSAALRGGHSLREKSADFLRRFLPRMLPGQPDKLPVLSPAVLIFIAIAVPLVIVAAASTAYIQKGRNEQHQVYLTQAQVLFDQANSQSDGTLQKVNLDAALEWVSKAEAYGVSDDSAALRRQLQSTLDTLEGIQRLDLQLALPGSFDNDVHITRIVASQAEDLYMLDSTNGRVFRLIYTRPGYEVDNQFVCGQGVVGGLIIGRLIDIAAAPIGNSFNAAVVGIDEFGNLLYCSSTSANTLAVTLPPPDAGWGKIKAISVDSSSMLVLDVGSNAVWRYEGFNLDFQNPPRFFFDSVVPDLSTAIDLFQNRDELFLLNQDGHMILCTYSNVYSTPTRCEDPYPYQMALPGQSTQEVATLGGNVEKMQLTQPPEPSVYFLDSTSPAVYQFSLVLNFVRKLRPSTSTGQLPQSPPSAFVVTTGRNLVLAFGNRIYSAPLPAP
jgi:hypothetical protein